MSRFKKNRKFRQDKGKKINGFEYQMERMSNLWLIGMLVVLPLIVTNFYFNILPTKYITACIVSLILILYYAYRLSTLPKDDKTTNFNMIRYVKKLSLKKDFVDICVIVFISICIISTITSYPFIKQSFLGNEGRYNGLLLMLFYAASYFIVTRYASFKKRTITFFLCAGLFICLFGITDYFRMDIFGFKVNVLEEQKAIYTSTIGNINTYTAVVGFVISLSGTLFMTKEVSDSKERKIKDIGELLFFYICMSIGFIALAMGNSDNGYLTLAAFFGLIPLVVWSKRRGFRRYLITLATYFSVIKLIGICNEHYSAQVLGISGLYEYISGFSGLIYIVLGLWAIAFGVCFFDMKTLKEKKDANMHIIARILWSILLIIGVIAVIYLIYIANKDPDVRFRRWGSLKNYLIFNDDWGTYRGYIWKATIEDYLKLPLIHKIFGTGPDTFGIYMVRVNADRYVDSVSRTGQYFDNAHNEYLHLFFTLGPFGVLSYIGIMAGSIFAGIRSWFKELAGKEEGRYVLAFSIVVLAHCVQSVVNLYLPITAPVVWAFIVMIINITRKDKDKEIKESRS